MVTVTGHFCVYVTYSIADPIHLRFGKGTLEKDIILFASFVRPSQGFWRFRGKGYLFSMIWGEGSFIFRDLGRFGGFREQGG